MDFRSVFRRASAEEGAERARRDVEEELAFHLAEVEAELRAEGLSPERARSEARRRFGDLEETRAYCVEQQSRRHTSRRTRMMIDGIRQDVALAFRTLRGSPGYALVVALTLAVGIAANTVIFSILNPYFLRPLPFDEADELVQLGQIDPRYDWDGARFSLAMLQDYEERSEAFEALGAYHYGAVSLTGERGSARAQVGYLTRDMFDVLGTPAARGRTFGPDEEASSASDVVVIAHGLWERRWGSDPGVVGRTLELDGRSHTVLGVMPPDFNFPYGEIELWKPIEATAATEPRERNRHLVVGRLADGWTPERARAELEGIQRNLARAHPEVDGIYAGMSVKPLREALNFVWDQLRLSATVLLAAVAFVLAIACVNVAGLTLARGERRARDVAIRAALGADRWRLVRHVVVESAVLAILGGVLGVGAAYGVTALIDPVIPEAIFKVGGVRLDGTVLAFSAAVTLVTPLIFGLAPALKLVRSEIGGALRSAGGRGGLRGLRGRRRLVVAQIALAVVLVAGTGLMIRSVMEIEGTDLGYEADELLTVEAGPPEARYADPAEVDDWFRRVEEGLAALPGVAGVGQVYPLPMNHESVPAEVARAGEEPPEGAAWPTALHTWASGDYFEAAGIRLLAGRTFDPSDRSGPGTAIVSRKLALRHFGERSPIGATLVVGESRTPRTVVGVVEDVYHSGFSEAQGAELPDPMIYVPMEAASLRRRFLVARTDREPVALAGPVRDVVAGLDPELSVSIRPLMDVVRENSFQWTVSSLFLGVFGLVAVLLASLGIYGLVSYSVAQRRRELGVRVALGAGRDTIRRMVLGEGGRLALVGGALGIAGALVLGRVIAFFLYEVEPWDPATFGGVLALFTGVVLVATFLPAHRATRVDPVEVLREE